jgi:hypothetical protein
MQNKCLASKAKWPSRSLAAAFKPPALSETEQFCPLMDGNKIFSQTL